MAFFLPPTNGSTRGPRARYNPAVMSQPTAHLIHRLAVVRRTLDELDIVCKSAFQPAPAMPQQGGPPMDPAMMQQGGPPMDPAMMQQMQQGGPPMDPAMMQQGGPPMDPSMQGGPPMDPSMQGGVPPEQLEEMMSLLEQMGQSLGDSSQRTEALEQQMQGQAEQIEELMAAMQSVMQPAQEQQAGGW